MPFIDFSVPNSATILILTIVFLLLIFYVRNRRPEDKQDMPSATKQDMPSTTKQDMPDAA